MVQGKIHSPKPYTVTPQGHDCWTQYDPGGFYDEIISAPGRAGRRRGAWLRSCASRR